MKLIFKKSSYAGNWKKVAIPTFCVDKAEIAASLLDRRKLHLPTAEMFPKNRVTLIK